MARAGVNPLVSILQYRASRVEPSRFRCPTLREHGRTPLERFTGSQSSGGTVAFPLPIMPRAGLTPIVSIIEHATRTVGALDFNRKALLAPGRTGPSRSVGSTSSGRTRKIQCTNIAHVRLNPVIATRRYRSCGLELLDAIRRGYPEAVGELTGGGSDRFPDQRSVRHSRRRRMREIGSCTAWSAADNRTSAPATQLAIRSVRRSHASRLRNRSSCRAIVVEQTAWPRPNWDCHSPCFCSRHVESGPAHAFALAHPPLRAHILCASATTRTEFVPYGFLFDRFRHCGRATSDGAIPVGGFGVLPRRSRDFRCVDGREP
jgi:hypothetical protein